MGKNIFVQNIPVSPGKSDWKKSFPLENFRPLGKFQLEKFHARPEKSYIRGGLSRIPGTHARELN